MTGAKCRTTTRALFALAMGWLLTGAANVANTTNAAAAMGGAAASADTCLMFSSECLARGKGNFATYQRFSDERFKIKRGDALEYDIYIDRSSPTPQGAVDMKFKERGALRDADNKSVKDDRGLPTHPGTDLQPAYGKWYHRRIPLDKVAGKSASAFTCVFEGDRYGRYTMFVDNVAVRRACGKSTSG